MSRIIQEPKILHERDFSLKFKDLLDVRFRIPRFKVLYSSGDQLVAETSSGRSVVTVTLIFLFLYFAYNSHAKGGEVAAALTFIMLALFAYFALTYRTIWVFDKVEDIVYRQREFLWWEFDTETMRNSKIRSMNLTKEMRGRAGTYYVVYVKSRTKIFVHPSCKEARRVFEYLRFYLPEDLNLYRHSCGDWW